ncbi:MAG: hypothetical protein ACK41T_09820 [Pseudobdellovibrio sp.]
MKQSIVKFIVFFIISNFAQASVWNAQRDWNSQDETNFSQFIQKQAGADYFKKLGSPYADLKLDCADAFYALRIYFSYKNGLNFFVKNGPHFTTTQFDHIKNPDMRVTEYIKVIAAGKGTESLALGDSYPIALKSIRAGDLFMYKIQTSDGQYSRHAYIIKSVNTNGTFDVLYSTQARRDAGLPMNFTKQYSFSNAKWIPNHSAPADQNGWGFRRAKRSDQFNVPASQIPGANYEQYKAANQYGSKFFDYVKSILTTVAETPEQTLNRMFDSLCHELDQRVEVVNMGLAYRESINKSCMDAATYDIYSTPSRDGAILGQYNQLLTKIHEVKNNNQWVNVSSKTQKLLAGVFIPSSRNAEVQQLLKQSCTFHQQQKLNTDIGVFYDALKDGKASNNPNDSLFLRWGIATTTKPTTCPSYMWGILFLY